MSAIGAFRAGRAVAAALLAAFTVVGCSSISYYAGSRPDPELLESTLKIGRSTTEDVRAALGKPSGKGAFLLPVVDAGPRQTWTYYYEDGSMNAERTPIDWTTRRIFLFVYFDQGRYDGYLWFSSLPGSRN